MGVDLTPVDRLIRASIELDEYFGSELDYGSEDFRSALQAIMEEHGYEDEDE